MFKTSKQPVAPSPGEEESVRSELSYTEGDRVVITGTDRTGRCRFIGSVPFAKGVWAGIEIPTPDGKNDGSVEGVRYFTCKPKHGLFIRALTAQKEAVVTSHINEDSRHTHLSSGTPIKGVGESPSKPSLSVSTPNSAAPKPRESPMLSASTPISGRGKSSIFDNVFPSASKHSSGSHVSAEAGVVDPHQVELIVKSEVFKRAVGSLVSKQSDEIVELKKRIQHLESQNRELREGLSKQEKLRPSMIKSLEQHEEAWKAIKQLTTQQVK